MACYEVVPETKEYKAKKRGCELPMVDNCGHSYTRPQYYVGFDVGLASPFAILKSYCPDCVKKVTQSNALSKEQYDRMRLILQGYGYTIPKRSSLKMKIKICIDVPGGYNPANDYSYALAA